MAYQLGPQAVQAYMAANPNASHRQANQATEINARNWQPGMATSGMGSAAGLRNAGLGSAMMSQWNAAAGDPAKQYALFQANPSLGNMAGTGINANWINNNAYSNIGANGQNLGSNASPLTPGQRNTSYNGWTSSFGNPQQPSPPFGPGGFGPPPPGGGANQAMQQFGQSTGIGGSWNPNIKPYIAPGQTGDTPGTYGQQAGTPGQPTGNVGQGGSLINLQSPGTNYGPQTPGVLGSQAGNGQISTSGGHGTMPTGGWGSATNLAPANTNYGVQGPNVLGNSTGQLAVDPRALGLQQPAQTAQPNAGRVTGLRYGGY